MSSQPVPASVKRKDRICRGVQELTENEGLYLPNGKLFFFMKLQNNGDSA